jgi:hypothetical protein
LEGSDCGLILIQTRNLLVRTEEIHEDMDKNDYGLDQDGPNIFFPRVDNSFPIGPKGQETPPGTLFLKLTENVIFKNSISFQK